MKKSKQIEMLRDYVKVLKEHNRELSLLAAHAMSEYLASLNRIGDLELELELMGGVQLPNPSKVVLNGPATVVVWDDGTKTVSKCREGDDYDPLFGILACVVRKITRNRGRSVDENEPLIAEISRQVHDYGDIGSMIDYCLFTLDMLTILMDSSDLWMPQLGPSEPADEPADEPEKAPEYELLSEREREQLRQTIRSLIDDGEL